MTRQLKKLQDLNALFLLLLDFVTVFGYVDIVLVCVLFSFKEFLMDKNHFVPQISLILSLTRAWDQLYH